MISNVSFHPGSILPLSILLEECGLPNAHKWEIAEDIIVFMA